MIQRRELIDTYFNKSGNSIKYRYLDQYLIDDHIILGMNKYLYKLVTDEEAASPTSADERVSQRYLTKLYTYYK
jgi:hypothetical protein